MDGPLFMDAQITPHRALSPRGQKVLLGVMGAADLVLSAMLIAAGAGVAVPLLALSLLALAIALAASNRRLGALEQIKVSAAEVRVVRLGRSGEECVCASPTAFTRVELVDEDYGAAELRLRLSDRELAVGESLSRPERLALAKALESAIRRARSGGPAW
jgi:uncharacterized membrane protein